MLFTLTPYLLKGQDFFTPIPSFFISPCAAQLKAARDSANAYYQLYDNEKRISGGYLYVYGLEKQKSFKADSLAQIQVGLSVSQKGETDRQTTRADSLAGLLEVSQTQNLALQRKLKQYGPRTWVGRQFEAIGTGLKVIGAATVVGGALKLFILK